jgi:hypothetical protein
LPHNLFKDILQNEPADSGKKRKRGSTIFKLENTKFA